VLTDAEYRYLAARGCGRLASIGPDGAPQVHPVPFVVDLGSDCIDIRGPRLRESQKYRNIRRDPRVCLMVDDEATAGGAADRRGLEIRGTAELCESGAGYGSDIIRIRPVRVEVWNVGASGHHCRFVV
jgi:pyridoxamine 5'-phosphate oxidase family protein